MLNVRVYGDARRASIKGLEAGKKNARRKGRAVIREETPRKGRSAMGGSTV